MQIVEPSWLRSTEVFVSFLPYDCSSGDLLHLFRPFGAIKAQVIRNRSTGEPLMFAFVKLATAEGVDAAIGALNNLYFHGRNIRVEYVEHRRSKRSAYGYSAHFVFKVPGTKPGFNGRPKPITPFNEVEIRLAMQQFGVDLKDVQINQFRFDSYNCLYTGYGFLTFHDKETQQKVFDYLLNRDVRVHDCLVTIRASYSNRNYSRPPTIFSLLHNGAPDLNEWSLWANPMF